MNKITSTLFAIVVIGMLIVPSVMLAVCGARPLCDECETEETCEAELLCAWETDECVNQGISVVETADINTAVGYISGLFSDMKVLILLAVGVYLGFYMIRRLLVIGTLGEIRKRKGK